MSEKTDIILIGAPTSGKSLIRRHIENSTPNLLAISIGDICREIIEDCPGHKLYKEVKTGNESQSLLNINIVLEIINNYISINKNDNKFILLDGFPRTKKQLKYLENIDFFNKKLLFVLMKLEEEEIITRFKKRFKNNRRQSDGDKNKIQKRLTLYKQETLPLIKYIENNINIQNITLDPSKNKNEFISDFQKYFNQQRRQEKTTP